MPGGIGAGVAAEMLQPAPLRLALGDLSAGAELLAIVLFVTSLYRTARQSQK